MFAGQLLFAQLMDFLPDTNSTSASDATAAIDDCAAFRAAISFFAWLLRNSRTAKACATSKPACEPCPAKLYHAGFRGKISRSTLADANSVTIGASTADFAQVLIAHARKLYANDAFAVDLDQPAYAFDSTTIDLCLALFPWAKFRRRKGAVKLHTLIDLHGNIPCFIHITDGKTTMSKCSTSCCPKPRPST